jgi:hypothetical protein
MSWVLTLLLATLSSGCSEQPVGEDGGDDFDIECSENAQRELAIVTYDRDGLSIPAGAVAKLQAMGRCSDWDSYYTLLSGRSRVAWTSSNAAVASVDSAGLFATEFSTGFTPGTTLITATWKDLTTNATLTVTSDIIFYGIDRLEAEKSTIYVGESVRVFVYGWYSGSKNLRMDPSAFSWTSSNASVARVDAAGVVTGVSEGTSVITAMSGDIQQSTTITVMIALTM